MFKRVPALLEAVALAHELIPDAPAEDQNGEIQDRFTKDATIERLMRKALDQVGVVPGRTYWDRLQLRIVPPRSERGVGTLGFHRDTWGSNLLCQTNWWLPLRALAKERTIAFYTAYWSRAIANSSAEWDLAAIRERRRRGKPLGDLPLVPKPTEQVDTGSELRMVIEPGDLLCFSGAHLHATVPNTSAETRVSVELRTVNRDDLEEGRGAPELDGSAPEQPLYWFRSMTDATPLSL